MGGGGEEVTRKTERSGYTIITVMVNQSLVVVLGRDSECKRTAMGYVTKRKDDSG